MSKLDELIRELCPDGVQVFRLEEIAHYAKTRIDCKTINEDNYVGVENLLQNKAGKTKATSVPTTGMVIAYQKNDILIGNIRPYLRKVWLADCEGGTNGDVLTVQIEDTEKVLPQFLYYVLSSEKFFLYDIQNSKGAKMPRGSKDAVMKFEVPLPPPEVQREIVRMVDSYTESVVELQKQLTAELTARKTQYRYYRDKMLTFGDDDKFKWENLGDVCDILTGYPFDSSQFQVSGVRLMRGMNIKRGNLFFSEEINRYWNSADGLEKYLLKENDIVIAMDGSLVGKSFGIVQAEYLPLLLVQRVARIRSEQVNNRYIYHYIACRFPSYVEKKKTGGAIPHVSQKDIASFRVPIPSADVQNRIVNVLDNFEKICSDLNIGLPAEIEARQKQYEYYRDKLLTFAETGNTILSRAEQSRAEQSRAEQSRAEQSRAEQSRAEQSRAEQSAD